MSFSPKYYIKTALYGIIPGGVGQQRQLKQNKNVHYNHERDKHPVRHRHNAKQGWKPLADKDSSDTTQQKRDYSDYNEYIAHQQQKFNEILQLHGGFSNRTIVTWRQRFYRRFRNLTKLLSQDATIVCLGARQGTEVEVLRDLGFKNAYGIDLNPGPNNPYVHKGDFMHLQEPDDSVDCIYSNSIDHAFELPDFITEQVRVLKSNGYALYDLPRYSGTRSPGAFEAIGWDSERSVIKQLNEHYKEKILSQQERKWHWTLFRGPKK